MFFIIIILKCASIIACQLRQQQQNNRLNTAMPTELIKQNKYLKIKNKS